MSNYARDLRAIEAELTADPHQSYQKLAAILPLAPSPAARAAGLVAQSRVLAMMGHNDDAFATAQQALASSHVSLRTQAYALQTIGLLQVRGKRHDDARGNLARALVLADASDDTGLQNQIRRNLARTGVFIEGYDSEAHLRTAIAKAEQIGDVEAQARGMLQLSYVTRRNGELQETWNLLNAAHALAPRISSARVLFYLSFEPAAYAWDQHRFAEAAQFMEAARRLLPKHPISIQRLKFETFLACCLADLGEFAAARERTMKSLEDAYMLGDIVQQARLQNNLCSYALEQGLLQEAEKAGRAAETYLQKYTLTAFLVASIYANLGWLSDELGKDDAAEAYFQKSLSALSPEDFPDTWTQIVARYALSRMLKADDPTPHRQRLVVASRLASHHQLIRQSCEIEHVLYRYYRRSQQFEQALHHADAEAAARRRLTQAQPALVIAPLLKAISEPERVRDSLRRERETLLSLLAFTGHELQNAMLVFRLNSQLARTHGDSAPPELSTLLEDIDQVTGRMSALLEDILRITQNTYGAPQRQHCALSALATRVVNRYRPLATQKRQQLSVHITPNISITAEPHQMESIVENLVSNAVKYTPQGGVIDVTLSQNTHEIRFMVEDDGPGLTAEDHDRLFQHFGRLSAQPTGDEPSTGLGLFLTRQLVESYNGSIRASSDGPGAGSRFIVILPSDTPTQAVAL
ncbi:MAG: tetratricopeptide repeat-containing sensor histidine kinase [Myxococcota bacterium]